MALALWSWPILLALSEELEGIENLHANQAQAAKAVTVPAIGLNETAYPLKVGLTHLDEPFTPFVSAKEIKGRLASSPTTTESVVRDERAAQKGSNLEDLLLELIALRPQRLDLLAEAT
jgi:hypothetical protein